MLEDNLAREAYDSNPDVQEAKREISGLKKSIVFNYISIGFLGILGLSSGVAATYDIFHNNPKAAIYETSLTVVCLGFVIPIGKVIKTKRKLIKDLENRLKIVENYFENKYSDSIFGSN